MICGITLLFNWRCAAQVMVYAPAAKKALRLLMLAALLSAQARETGSLPVPSR